MTKRKTKKDFCLISGTVYPFDTLITTEDTEDIIQYIEENKLYKLNDQEKKALITKDRGRTIMLLGGQIIILLKKEKTKIGIDIPTLVHELFHATCFLFNRIGIKLSDDSEEAFAYYQEWLMRKALEHYDP